MTTSRSCPHYPSEPLPATTSASGEPLNIETAMMLLGACADGCEPCQRRHTETVLDGPPLVIAHLTGMAFLSLNYMIKAAASRLGLAGDVGGAIASSAILSTSTRAVFAVLQDDDLVRAEELVLTMNREARAALLADALDTLATASAAMRD